tara:strand:+ start:507 stop:710 length:204 start_codon:yes stop_codon:yes gene_type:complete
MTATELYQYREREEALIQAEMDSILRTNYGEPMVLQLGAVIKRRVEREQGRLVIERLQLIEEHKRDS